jgi:hypothetical protein
VRKIPQEIDAWKGNGYSIPEAITWVDAGFSMKDALAWKANGFAISDADLVFSGDEAKQWVDAGFGIKDAIIWKKSGFSMNDALRWKNECKASAPEAREWLTAKYTIAEAQKWIEVTLSMQHALLWRKAGFSLDDTRRWLNVPTDSPELVQQWQKAGHSYPEALAWSAAGVPFPVAIAWKAAGYKSGEVREWQNATHDNLEKANAWKKAGFTAEETRLWINETSDDMARAKKLKAEGINIVTVIRHEDYGLVDSNTINQNCPDGVQSLEELLTTVPKETMGICYTFRGSVSQVLDETRALFAHALVKKGAHTATVIEFEKGRVPQSAFQGIVKGSKSHKHVPKEGSASVVPQLKVVVAKQTR